MRRGPQGEFIAGLEAVAETARGFTINIPISKLILMSQNLSKSCKEMLASVRKPTRFTISWSRLPRSGTATRGKRSTPENLVRIPTFKHREITAWYMKGNDDYGGLSPREYLRDKDWNMRRRVGLDALIRFGVLKP